MKRRRPRSTRTDTRLPYKTLFRSGMHQRARGQWREAERAAEAVDAEALAVVAVAEAALQLRCQGIAHVVLQKPVLRADIPAGHGGRYRLPIGRALVLPAERLHRTQQLHRGPDLALGERSHQRIAPARALLRVR